jgi:hypothetical protein
MIKKDAQLRARDKSCATQDICSRECAKRTFVRLICYYMELLVLSENNGAISE